MKRIRPFSLTVDCWGGYGRVQRVTYSLAGQAIAMHVTGDPDNANNGLFYLHSDHLGSASAMSDSSGSQVEATTRYTPFGSYRAGGPNEITDRGFTGHRHNDGLGLIYMNARYYVKGIGRFASADTIVPDPANPQSLNRYTYVLNSPLRYTDPTGHCINGYTGEVSGPDGTSGICPNTMSAIQEGHAAIDAYQNDPDNASSLVAKYRGSLITIADEPKPDFPIVPFWNQKQGDIISTATDHAGVRLSYLKTAISSLGVLSNFGVPLIADIAADQAEDIFDTPSLIIDVAGEIANGDTRIAFESNGVTVILGQDVSQTAVLILLDRIFPGSEVDFAINAYETYYTTQKLRDEMPNRWETRVGTVSPYFEIRKYDPQS